MPFGSVQNRLLADGFGKTHSYRDWTGYTPHGLTETTPSLRFTVGTPPSLRLTVAKPPPLRPTVATPHMSLGHTVQND